ncbi:MAG: hypothetical protein GF315_03390 [candidate division Zixibacteria bacterium]|nr:hypothetical protein [candidate division Zixibacteria bacterium]
MLKINLLPKELQKKGLSLSFDKNLLYMLAGALVLILIMAGISIYQSIQLGDINEKIADAKAQTETYRDEITQIDELNALKEEILARISAIEVLDKNRSYWVNLLGDMAVRVPSQVWITSFKQAGAGPKEEIGKIGGKAIEKAKEQTTLDGRSFSLNALASLLIQMDRSEYFTDIRISSVILGEVEGKPTYMFTLSFNLEKLGQVRADTETVKKSG